MNIVVCVYVCIVPLRHRDKHGNRQHDRQTELHSTVGVTLGGEGTVTVAGATGAALVEGDGFLEAICIGDGGVPRADGDCGRCLTDGGWTAGGCCC